MRVNLQCSAARLLWQASRSWGRAPTCRRDRRAVERRRRFGSGAECRPFMSDFGFDFLARKLAQSRSETPWTRLQNLVRGVAASANEPSREISGSVRRVEQGIDQNWQASSDVALDLSCCGGASSTLSTFTTPSSTIIE